MANYLSLTLRAVIFPTTSGVFNLQRVICMLRGIWHELIQPNIFEVWQCSTSGLWPKWPLSEADVAVFSRTSGRDEKTERRDNPTRITTRAPALESPRTRRRNGMDDPVMLRVASEFSGRQRCVNSTQFHKKHSLPICTER